jgi:hypothetical protein
MERTLVVQDGIGEKLALGWQFTVAFLGGERVKAHPRPSTLTHHNLSNILKHLFSSILLAH